MSTQYKPRDAVQVNLDGKWHDAIYIRTDEDDQRWPHLVYILCDEKDEWADDASIRHSPATGPADTLEVRAWVGVDNNGHWQVEGWKGASIEAALNHIKGDYETEIRVIAEIVARVPRPTPPPVIEGEVIA